MMHRACGDEGYNDGGRVRSNSMNGDLRLKSFDELTDTRRIGATKLVAVRSAHRRLRNLKTFHFHLSYKVIGGPQLLEHRLNFSFRIKAESSKSVQVPQPRIFPLNYNGLLA